MGLCLGAASPPKAPDGGASPSAESRPLQEGGAATSSKGSSSRGGTGLSSSTGGSSTSSKGGSGRDKQQQPPQQQGDGGLSTSTSGSGSKRRPSVTKPKREAIETNYTLGQQLGEGNSATVRECVHKGTGVHYAVKIFRKSKLTPEDVKSLLEEVAILRYLDSHPNIIRAVDFLEDKAHFFVVMDLVKGGELFDRITVKTSYTEKEARDLFIILVGAIRYIHSKGVVHRDLKPENLLLKDESDDVTVKLADFGFAARVEGDKRVLLTQCGTPGYVAPEILKREPYGKAVDMWSIGVITYILLGGYPPFYDDDQRRLFEKIKHARFVFHPEIWNPVSTEAKDLITKMLTVDPKKRLTADEALAHPWVLKDDEYLHGHNLEASKVELRKFNARRKFRAGVRSIMAANKMTMVLAGLRAAAAAKEADEVAGAEEEGGAAAAEEQQQQQEAEAGGSETRKAEPAAAPTSSSVPITTTTTNGTTTKGQ